MCMPFSEAVFTFRKDKVPTARAGEDAKGNKKKEKEPKKNVRHTRYRTILPKCNNKSARLDLNSILLSQFVS